MNKVVAIQMDHLKFINVNTDTTILIANELQNRGYRLFIYHPQNLFLHNNIVMAHGSYIKLRYSDKKSFFDVVENCVFELKNASLILIRQNPPFNMAYITATYILDLIKNDVLILNEPSEVRNSPEKFFPFAFSAFMPPTLIASSYAAAEMFLHEHKDNHIVIKPISEYGGSDVRLLSDTPQEIIVEYIKKYGQFILQKFLPAVRTLGDKRALLVDGEVVAVFSRIPQNNEIRSNIILGAKAKTAELTEKELLICNALKPELKKRQLFLAGIDIIDGYLTEVNVTSPTGFVIANNLYNISLEATIVTQLEEKIATYTKKKYD